MTAVPTTPSRGGGARPCNGTGSTDPQSTKGWAIVDFDWSNWKGIGSADGWAKHKPMDCEELMVKQTEMTVAASPGTKVMVYRNMIKVRKLSFVDAKTLMGCTTQGVGAP